MDQFKKLIREVPDFPKPGILFYDITTLLKDRDGFRALMSELAKAHAPEEIDVIAGIESRGFIFGSLLAAELGKGFIPVRKPGKLPAATESVSYELEYGSDTLEIHRDAIEPGQRVLVADDLLATGGTAAATCELIEKIGGKVVGLSFVIELSFLNGRDRLGSYAISSLLEYDS